ncbi:MAG: hypothetical protein LBQ49_01120 [Rickettsiales bacterium]|jgi:hypothetical protein|nr:hypothetical protein [Rickettsiales bacterium]
MAKMLEFENIKYHLDQILKLASDTDIMKEVFLAKEETASAKDKFEKMMKQNGRLKRQLKKYEVK